MPFKLRCNCLRAPELNRVPSAYETDEQPLLLPAKLWQIGD